MSKTIAAKLVEILEQAGVTHIHGVVGDSLNGITDELRKSGKIKWIHYRHEEAAAFAAGAEAQLTGKLAVCAGSCGPGNMHLINGLYDAHRSNAPVLAIAAQIPSEQIGTSYFQETRPEALFRECSYYCETIASAKQMPRVLQIAIQTAISLKGVSIVSLSGDVAMQTIDNDELEHPLFLNRPLTRPSDTDLKELAMLIDQAEAITLLCGAGCAGAHDELITLAGLLSSPTVHALRGKEYVQYDNPFDVGMTGLIGMASGNHAVKNCDLLLMLGTDFPYKEWYPDGAKIVQIDIRPERLGRRCKLDLGLTGDIGETIKALIPLVKAKTDALFLKDCQARYKQNRINLDKRAAGETGKLIHPEYLTKVLSDQAEPDTIFTADVGTPTVWAARYLDMKKGRRLIGSFNHGSMASAMPQAIGAQLAFPERQVISLSGDGGFAMMMGDILTIYQYDLPVKLIIYNNGSLGFVAMEMKVIGMPPFGTELKNPDFAKMAEAIGIMGIRVENSEDLPAAVAKALAHKGPVLIDVLTNPTELAMPPQINFDEAKGFGIYMLRQTLLGDGAEVWDTLNTNFLK
ncbi:ubiquinone-dependent pyruvate dehydrogenase [Mucilaginibacter psychrotolerans]|uniref:Ubiquinone-dependent pyruvate dehydrogenase n=1 Tax=Mucilaginibacter psychrotolerans TaxID=1524096 RepID=A0A4Y8S431_9SPHI|nr:ubiquinone-dependent pyruvate dehydrogenase [Mucilaginibacter psychrotolerans]TFF33330.1 ubiquinone-dependent pyruvate dehydrogenase [Mucilaginibacter psychrotolerans]